MMDMIPEYHASKHSDGHRVGAPKVVSPPLKPAPQSLKCKAISAIDAPAELKLVILDICGWGGG